MSTQIDSIGTFVGKVIESGVNTTKKGFPQWVFRVLATKKYIEDKTELEHFQLSEPGYVEWNFDEDAVGFMCLFNDAGPLLNYEQVQLATGWDGTSFDSLGEPIVGKDILFRIQAKNNYTKEDGSVVDNTGKLEIGWVDAPDAPPTRQLKTLDAAAVKDLNSKFLAGLKKTAPAKPVAAAAAKPGGKPGAKPAGKPVVAAAPGSSPSPAPAAPVASTPSPAPASPPPAASAVASTSTPAAATPATVTKPKTKAPAVPKTEKVEGLPKETTQADAWAYLCSVKGDNEDSVLQDAWLAACGEVFPTKDEDAVTPAEWAKVRDVVIKDLLLGDNPTAAAA